MIGTLTLNKEWKPLVFSLAHTDSAGRVVLQHLWTRSLCLFLALASVVTLFSQEIVKFGLGEEYLASAAIVPWVALIGLLGIPREFLANLGLALDKVRALTAESILSGAFFVGVTLVLIPMFGASGAASAGALAYGVGCVFFFSRPWNPFDVDRALILRATAFCGTWLLAAYMGGTPLIWLVGTCLLGFLGYEGLKYWAFLGTIQPIGGARE